MSEAFIIMLCAGSFYLLQKIFFFFSEATESKEVYCRWRIPGWGVYIIGLFFWLYVFFYIDKILILGWMELCGLPAMILGLINSLRMYRELKGRKKKEKKQKKLWRILFGWKLLGAFGWEGVLVIIGALIGTGFSIDYYGSLNSFAQGLQLAAVVGFLAGTYLLAKDWLWGYLFYALMNGTTGWLMYIKIQKNPNFKMLFYMQMASIVFVVGAFLVRWRRQKKNKPGKCQ